MRPLAPVAHEYRAFGGAEVVVAFFFAIVAAILNPVEAGVGMVIGSAIFGPIVYFSLLRPYTRRGIAQARPSPTEEREDPSAAVRRIAWPIAGQFLVSLVLAGLARGPGLFGGIALGIGVAALVTARRIDHWQTARGASVLRDPGERVRRQAGERRTPRYYVQRPE